MKKSGFTLIELIAVLVILSIITMMAAPNIVSLMKSGNEESFVSQASEIVDKATYMYKTLSIRSNQDIFVCNSEGTTGTTCQILMKNVDMRLPEKDSYGYTYNLDESSISFVEPDASAANSTTRTVTVFIKSCKDTKCHCIKKTSNGNVILTTDDIKKGDTECASN